ncbi:formimidoylglutamate deiminase, partial [Klebsiella pneumoniae]|nr:formimidoylglutamate deiminase [Klebsiella pneumoniae]
LNRWLFAGHAGQIRDVYVGGTPRIINGQHAQQQAVAADFLQVLRQLAEATA